LIAALALGLAAVVAPVLPPAGPEVVAIVVGSNHSPGAGVAELRYADDDAIQNARTMSLLGASTTLLVSADAETRELFPGVPAAGAATRDALVSALDRAFITLGQARAAGRATRLYLFFAGHGDTVDGRPFLQLDDARLWRDDLAQLLRRSPAQQNNLVIDACSASLFVGARGPGGERAPLAPGFSRLGGPAWPPGTGLVTARSAGGQTHEWTEFQGGIFSHEVRSGLLGAADANLDGRITYRELAAFVARANQAIVNHKYRPEVVTAAPGGDLDAVVATLPDGPLLLELDRDTGRAFVESERGVRLADLHPADGARVRLRLPIDLGALFVEKVDAGTEVRIDAQPGHVWLSQLEAAPPRARARGAAHEAFRMLFALPFGEAAVDSWHSDVVISTAVDRPARSRWLPLAVTGAGATAALVGAGLGISSYVMAGHADSGQQRLEAAPRIQARNQAALATGVAGLVAAGVGLAWAWWWSRP
jgi:hypothetical protein